MESVEMTDETDSGSRPIATAVGSGGTLTYDILLREYQATQSQPLVRSLASAVAACMPAFLVPPVAGAALVFKGPPETRPTAQWVHERAMDSYFPKAAQSTSWKEQVLLIKQLLQVTVGDLARFFAVERPTVYHWLSGSQPRLGKQRRLDALERFARSWQALGLGPLRAYLTRTVVESNTTLEALLTDAELNVAVLASHLNALADSLPDTRRPRVSISERLAARGFRPIDEQNDRKQRARFVRQTSTGEE